LWAIPQYLWGRAEWADLAGNPAARNNPRLQCRRRFKTLVGTGALNDLTNNLEYN